MRSNHRFSASRHASFRSHEGTVLLTPGLAGERLFDEIVMPELNADGYKTVSVHHSRGRHPVNAETARSVDIHHAALHAVEESGGDKALFIIAYSMGGNDLANFLEWYKDKRERVPYEVMAVGGLAALGFSKASIGGSLAEAGQTLASLCRHPITEGRIQRRIGLNVLLNVPLILAETVTCVRSQPTDTYERCINEGVLKVVYAEFGTNDKLVPAPEGWPYMFEGDHRAPMLEPDISRRVLEKIAA